MTCPRISPEWELAAQLALVKPKPYTKDKIAHRDPRQVFPRGARRALEQCAGIGLAIDFPRSGPHRITVDFRGVHPSRAKRLARKISRCLPELWFALSDGTYLRGGVLYLRTGKYNLELVRATRVRLRRSVRFGFLRDLPQRDLNDARTPPRHHPGQDHPAQRSG